MKRAAMFILTLGFAVAVSPASGQKKKGHGNGRDRDHSVVVAPSKAGPKFCQNGQGHPVHGRQWCLEHGFGLGTSRPRIVYLSQPQIVALVPTSTWTRLELRARQRGYDGPYVGTSYYTGGTRVVTLMAGSQGFAELVFDLAGRLLSSDFLR